MEKFYLVQTNHDRKVNHGNNFIELFIVYNFAFKGELLAKKDKLSPWQQSGQTGKCNIFIY